MVGYGAKNHAAYDYRPRDILDLICIVAVVCRCDALHQKRSSGVISSFLELRTSIFISSRPWTTNIL